MLRSNFESQKKSRKSKPAVLKEDTILEAKKVKLAHKKPAPSEQSYHDFQVSDCQPTSSLSELRKMTHQALDQRLQQFPNPVQKIDVTAKMRYSSRENLQKGIV